MNKLKKSFVFITAVVLSASAHAKNRDESKFFARDSVERKDPYAFVIRPESYRVIGELEALTNRQIYEFAYAIQGDQALLKSIASFEQMSIAEQIPVLKRVFQLECATMGVTPPELVFSNDRIPGAAYFDFDLNAPGPGAVILNPSALEKETNKYASLILLIHETRHSAQFQLATKSSNSLARSFYASFRAQKDLKGQLSFLDFMSLVNEYEAFRFANGVVGQLTDFKVEAFDMGSFASQFDEHGQNRIDLIHLFKSVGANGVLDAFNKLEREQYQILFPRG